MAKKEVKQKSIEETLWESANKLRGSVEPAEYIHVVLGLIFLKFASDKFEEHRKSLIAKGQEKYIEKPEFYNQANVFFLDEELPAEKSELLLSNNNENEKYFVQNREIFCLLRVGVLDSLMGKDYIAKKLKVSATARNWRTVNKILGL